MIQAFYVSYAELSAYVVVSVVSLEC